MLYSLTLCKKRDGTVNEGVAAEERKRVKARRHERIATLAKSR